MRMPFLIRAPGRVRPGSVVARLVSNVDFAPTVLDIAGQPVPADMRGRSFPPLLLGENPADWPSAVYYRYWMHLADHDVPAHLGVRTEEHKLVFYYGLPLDATGAVPEPTPPSWELYDLRCDPEERRNVYESPEYATVRDELTRTLHAVRCDVGDEDARFPEVARRMRQSSASPAMAATVSGFM